MQPVSAWPTAAEWLSGRRPGSTPTAAGNLASRRQGPRSTSTEPQGASAGGDATSAYRRLFRAKMEECKAEARMKGESWTMRAVIGKVNAKMGDHNRRANGKVLSLWNASRKLRESGVPRGPNVRARG